MNLKKPFFATADTALTVQISADTRYGGTVPTPYGVIAIEWEKAAENFHMCVTLPSPQMEAEIILTNGEKALQKGGKIDHVCKIQ